MKRSRRNFFPGRDPIGKHVTINSVSAEIVGIAKDARVNSLRGAIEPKFYAAADQNSGAFSFEIRTIGDPSRVVDSVRRSFSGVDENLSISDVQTLEQKIAVQNAQPRLIADVCTIFGVIALFLAAMGIYAVLSHNVARRRNEFGIRMALGAARSRITGMVLEQTGLMIVAGLVAGVIAAAVAARVLAAQLYGVKPQRCPAGLSLVMSMSTAPRNCMESVLLDRRRSREPFAFWSQAPARSLHPCCSRRSSRPGIRVTPRINF